MTDRVPITRSRRRTRELLVILVLLALLYPISRHFLVRTPAPLPASASDTERIRYYNERVIADPSDLAAYIALGNLEESRGYYTSALRRLTIARALGASDSQVAGSLGRSLLRLERLDEAKVEIDRAVRASPNSVEAIANLAGWYNEVGRSDEAIHALKAYVTGHPALTDPKATASRQDVERLMLCFAEAGDGTMTLQLAKRIIQIAPKEPNGYAIAGKELLAEKRLPEALADLNNALELAPKEASLHFLLGVGLAYSGQHEAALTEWLKAITLNHNELVAYYWIGGEYARRKQWQSAGVAYAQAALLNAYDIRACRLAAVMFERAKSTLDADYWSATSAGISGDFRNELRYALAIMKSVDPNMRRIGLKGIADAYRGMQRPTEFLQAMRNLATHHSYADYMMLAEAYADVDDFTQQKAFLQKALPLAPDHGGEVHYHLAMTAKNLGQSDLAESELEQAVQAEPQNIGYHRDLADQYFERRSLADRLARALREYSLIVQQENENSVDWQHLGNAYAAAGNLRKATSCLEHAIDLQPGNGPCYQELGRIYAKLGDRASSDTMLALHRRYVNFTEEQQTLTTRARAARRDPKMQIELADFLVRTGDYDTAAKEYAIALQLRPNDPVTRHKLSRIYGLVGRKDLQLELEHPVPTPQQQAKL